MTVSLDRIRQFAIASVAGGVLVTGLAVAPAAHGYPPGVSPKIATNKSTYKPKKKVKVQARKLQAGCLVKFVWPGKGAKGFERREKAKTVGKNGKAAAQIKKGPKSNGKYVVKVKVRVNASKKIGKTCSAEEASTKYRVRR
jgi:hypothetical protein